MSWRAEYILLILESTLVDFTAGKRAAPGAPHRTAFLLVSLTANLGLLFFFKYANFAIDTVNTVTGHLGGTVQFEPLNVLLPVGISFYTFQTLSYTLDVYRGHREPESHLGRFALYVSFFPQRVAGPMERSTRLLPQLAGKFDFDYRRVSDGLKLICWGLFKKLIIADRAGMLVDQVYNNVYDQTGFALIVASYLFAFQIFCDFSGYSDIAIGCAQVMGYTFMKNFRQPYFAGSISEFWNRWHISLSTWFRDYLYIPLGGNRVSPWRWHVNIFLVFLLSGIWHGANWTFAVWGALHGGYYLASSVTNGF